ncbi:MAG TPA: Fe-S protein assembly co-chaperone HscB [Usitatibacteraceae bacterium]|nr:Fe-S protein assembly co-chaperone HscB [Usitatibacteraceae bacterium]
MSPDFSKNHFALFGLPAAFEIDAARLDATYRELQREVHPDRFAAAGDSEQRLAAQWATRVNEAYRTLKSPLDRARYLLHLGGVDTDEESDTSMPVEFLMEQMHWRERLESARTTRDHAALEALAARANAQRHALIEALRRELADPPQEQPARLTVRKLRFVDKLSEEIDIALGELDD